MARVAATGAKPKPSGSTPKRGPARASKAKPPPPAPTPEPAAPNVGGRPPLLTPEREARILQAVRIGAPLVLAAGYGGISYSTLRNWVVRGEAEQARYEEALETDEGAQPLPSEVGFLKFLEAYKEAEAAAAVRWLSRIEKAAEEHWQAAGWKAERRWPEHFGRQRVELTDGDGKPLGAPVAIYVPTNRRAEAVTEEPAAEPAATPPAPPAIEVAADVVEEPQRPPLRRRVRRPRG